MSKYDEDEEADVSIFIKLTIALGFDEVVCQNFYTTSRFTSLIKSAYIA